MSKALKILTIESKEEEKKLREKSIPVTNEDLNNDEFKNFLNDLLYTAQHSEEQGNVPAGGIAAIQVGVNKRAFFTLNYDTDQWQLFINPSIEPISFLKTTTEEGCLSVPKIEGKVQRYYKIKVRYQDINGKWLTKKYIGINAVSIQHELDHLEGILFIDKIDNAK